MVKKDLKYLSASRIKTLDSCSWLYWCNYHLHLPQSTNTGALRGTICHLVLELLLKPKHKKHYDVIMKKGEIAASKAIDRLVKKFLLENRMLDTYDGPDPRLDEDHYALCDSMILVGLKQDFFGEGGSQPSAEYEFVIENDEPSYNMRGFIDKTVKYQKESELVISDYKTSKAKFQGKDLETNVQAMMYSLVAKKLWPKLKPIVRFIFLKFPRQPIQELRFDEETLNGFERYLETVFDQVNNFDEEQAVSNFAYDKPKPKKGFGGPLMCGFAQKPGQLKKDGTLMWHCPYKFAFDYYALVDDETGEVAKSALEEGVLSEKEGYSLKVLSYEGCPKFNNKGGQANKDDFLD